MKKLTATAYPKLCSTKLFADILNSATDVEELTLEILRAEEQQGRNFVSTSVVHEITGILNKVPDHSLKGLSVQGAKLSEELFQELVNRQRT